MALLFAENGLHVSLEDPSEDAMKGVKQQAEKDGFGDRISIHSGTPTSPSSLKPTDTFQTTNHYAKVLDRPRSSSSAFHTALLATPSSAG